MICDPERAGVPGPPAPPCATSSQPGRLLRILSREETDPFFSHISSQALAPAPENAQGLGHPRWKPSVLASHWSSCEREFWHHLLHQILLLQIPSLCSLKISVKPKTTPLSHSEWKMQFQRQNPLCKNSMAGQVNTINSGQPKGLGAATAALSREVNTRQDYRLRNNIHH